MPTTAAITPPPLTAEANPSASSVSQWPEQQLDLTLTSDHPSNTSQPEKSLPVPILPPLLINSAAELKDLSTAIASFRQCYEDLRNHLDSIKAALSSKLPPKTPHVTPIVPSPSLEVDVSETSPKPDVSDGTVLQKQEQGSNPLNSELEGLCKTMCSHGVRRYLLRHLSNLPQLREEVPKALKLAPKPQKLVLESLGKFYLQGNKAFSRRNSPMIPARESSIFLLECFLLMMGMDTANGKDNGVLSIEKAVKVEAEKAALAWRKRMVAGGSLAKANQIDARGLLLFVACFGISNSFKMDDIRELMVAANAKEIAGVLRLSHVLMNKIPEIVEIVKQKMEVDVVNLVYTFGLEERFNPQTILVSYLRESKESWKRPKKGSQGSADSLNEANKKQLAALKSIRQCLEHHKIDPAKLLPGWQVNENITTLEKDIADADRKSGERTSHKRKSGGTETSSTKPKTHEAKRSRYNVSHGPRHHKTTGHVDSRRNLSNSGLTNYHPNNYPAYTSVVYGRPGAGLLPESIGIMWHGTYMEGLAGVQNASSVGFGTRGSVP